MANSDVLKLQENKDHLSYVYFCETNGYIYLFGNKVIGLKSGTVTVISELTM